MILPAGILLMILSAYLFWLDELTLMTLPAGTLLPESPRGCALSLLYLFKDLRHNDESFFCVEKYLDFVRLF